MIALNHFLALLEHSSLAAAVRGETGYDFMFANLEIVHVIAVATVFSSIVMVDLRLLGLGARNSAVSRITAEYLPLTWIAYAVALLVGSVMFVSKAHTYFYNRDFELKFLCMVLAGINMLVFHLGAYRSVLAWDNQLPPPRAARLAGAVSIALWIGVIFFGRWTGFSTEQA
jgi:hypothetical protein